MTGVHPTGACVCLALVFTCFCQTSFARSECRHEHSSAETCYCHRLGKEKESEHRQPPALIFSLDLFCVHRPELKSVYKDGSASCCSRNYCTVTDESFRSKTISTSSLLIYCVIHLSATIPFTWLYIGYLSYLGHRFSGYYITWTFFGHLLSAHL